MSEIDAYHEAGHALMAVTVGARVVSVTVDPDWDDGPARTGDTQIAWPAGRFSDREFQERLVQVALAGPVAEMIHRGEPLHPGLIPEWAADWRDAWEAADPLVRDERKRLAWLEQVVREVYQLFDGEACWAAVAAIADHLLAHETLEHEDVREIAAQWL